MAHASGVRMTGPLAAHQDGLWADLLARGYTRLSARNLLRVAACLSRWLGTKRLAASDLTATRIDAFARYRRTRGYTGWRTPSSLQPILASLRGLGVAPVPEPAPVDDSPRECLLREYEVYLVRDRRIRWGTASGYVRPARRFLDGLSVADPSALAMLSVDAVCGFVLREARSSSVGYAKMKVTALRSFLRYLHVRGLCRDLSGAVPAVAGHRLSGLPRAMPEEDVRRLLGSCDRKTATGRRDYAVLLLLSRLGLRSCEVASLDLDDVLWTRAEIRVRGKGAEGLLPLPRDVGKALVAYLKRRRVSDSRRLFLQACAPHREFGNGTVGGIVQSACRRAGLPPMGAHRLRHTAATSMLRRGASLPEVAQVLRHRSLATTAIYAKVDRLALRTLARPWPGGAS